MSHDFLPHTHASVRKAYKKRILETHPDKLDPNSTEEERLAADDQFHLVRGHVPDIIEFKSRINGTQRSARRLKR